MGHGTGNTELSDVNCYGVKPSKNTDGTTVINGHNVLNWRSIPGTIDPAKQYKITPNTTDKATTQWSKYSTQ